MEPIVSIKNEYPHQETSPKNRVTYNLAILQSEHLISITHSPRNHEDGMRYLSVDCNKSQNNLIKTLNLKNIKQSTLPSIIHEEYTHNQRDQIDTRQTNNVFKNEILQKMKSDQLKNSKPYLIVGHKEVKSYQTKIAKKRHAGKRTESAISISRFSSTAKSDDKNDYLTREDVIANFVPLSGLQNSPRLDSSINRARDRLNKYSMLWGTQKQNSATMRNNSDNGKTNCSSQIGYESNSIFHNEYASKVKNHQSILDFVDKYRQKVQVLEQLSLNEHKEHVSENIWPLTLRKKCGMQTYHQLVSMQKSYKITKKCGLKMQGNKKLQTQLDWVNQKVNHVFTPIDKVKTILSQMFKDNLVSESKGNRTMKTFR